MLCTDRHAINIRISLEAPAGPGTTSPAIGGYFKIVCFKPQIISKSHNVNTQNYYLAANLYLFTLLIITMKPILAFIFTVVFYSSAFALTIEAKLWAIAKKQYPTDTEKQKYVYDQQKNGYNYMLAVTDPEVKAFAEKQYPDDYSMQEFVYDQQKTDKAYMNMVTDAELKLIAIKQYPTDHSMQKYVYDQQATAKEFMQHVTNATAKQKARQQYPDDYSMQKYIYEQE